MDVIYSLQNVFPNTLMCYCVSIPTQTQEKCTIFGPIQFLRCHVAFLIAEPNHINKIIHAFQSFFSSFVKWLVEKF